MKPKEFDELVRQKFDWDDFAYNPANWDRLAEKLDGKEKKRSIIMWWWVPLAGMAASVALAIGVSTLLKQGSPTGAGLADMHNSQNAPTHTAQQYDAPSSTPLNSQVYTPGVASTPGVYASAAHSKQNKTSLHGRKQAKGTRTTADEMDNFAINFNNAMPQRTALHTKPIDLLSAKESAINKNKEKTVNEEFATFTPQEEAIKKVPKLSIILSGGVNHGSQNSGYTAGATIRRMVSDKVYVESDVAFATSNNTQSTAYAEHTTTGSTGTASVSRHMSAAKVSSPDANNGATPALPADVIKQKDISYDLYYAQVTPSIGYKVMKKMSVALGPDFQQMLVDNRPAPSTVDRNVVQVAPLFDVGFIGKTEYALTKKVKAAVSYRKGVNNVITPTDKYIDRDYLQFQVRYTILNK